MLKVYFISYHHLSRVLSLEYCSHKIHLEWDSTNQTGCDFIPPFIKIYWEVCKKISAQVFEQLWSEIKIKVIQLVFKCRFQLYLSSYQVWKSLSSSQVCKCLNEIQLWLLLFLDEITYVGFSALNADWTSIISMKFIRSTSLKTMSNSIKIQQDNWHTFCFLAFMWLWVKAKVT